MKDLVPLCAPGQVMELAVKAREDGRLRHAPLLLLREWTHIDGFSESVVRYIQATEKAEQKTH